MSLMVMKSCYSEKIGNSNEKSKAWNKIKNDLSKSNYKYELVVVSQSGLAHIILKFIIPVVKDKSSAFVIFSILLYKNIWQYSILAVWLITF